MDILFINANLYGHINPTLGLVKKLTERSHHVDYFCDPQFAESVTTAGANWVGFGNKLIPFLENYHPTDRHPFFMLMECMLLYDEVALPEIIPLLKTSHYDMIISDSYFGGALFLKQMLQIPIVCSHSSFAISRTPVPDRMLVPGFHPQLDHCYQVLKRICETHHIEEPSLEQLFISKSELNIVYTTRNFNADPEVCEPNYLFAGPSLDRLQKTMTTELARTHQKLIYISLGSINTNFIDFYKMCIAAFKDADYDVFMSIGTKCDITQLGKIPKNFTVDRFLPQLNILEQADLFITHAGFNSVNEALSFGVPMIALPLVNDQYMVAKRIASLQLGTAEDMKELSAELLKEKADLLISDTQIRQNCREMSREMKENANIEQVVVKLEEYVTLSKRR